MHYASDTEERHSSMAEHACKIYCQRRKQATHLHTWVPVPVGLVGAGSANSDGGGTILEFIAGWGQAQGNTSGTSLLGLPAVGAGSALSHCSLLVLVGVQGALDGIGGVGGVNVVTLQGQGASSSAVAALVGSGDAIRAGGAVGLAVEGSGVGALLAQLADALVHVGASRGLCTSTGQQQQQVGSKKSVFALNSTTTSYVLAMHGSATWQGCCC
jgi:hypothetical protein